MKRVLMRRTREDKSAMAYMGVKERCIYCEHIHGFRNKIPVCGAEKCIYEDNDVNGD